jgi:hypothetical protein
MSAYDGEDEFGPGQDALCDAEPVISSETPHFDALFSYYGVGNG